MCTWKNSKWKYPDTNLWLSWFAVFIITASAACLHIDGEARDFHGTAHCSYFNCKMTTPMHGHVQHLFYKDLQNPKPSRRSGHKHILYTRQQSGRNWANQRWACTDIGWPEDHLPNLHIPRYWLVLTNSMTALLEPCNDVISVACPVALFEHHQELVARYSGLRPLRNALWNAAAYNLVLINCTRSHTLHIYWFLVVHYNARFHTFLHILPFPLLPTGCPIKLQTVRNHMYSATRRPPSLYTSLMQLEY